jgi:uncharacterized protein YkwD
MLATVCRPALVDGGGMHMARRISFTNASLAIALLLTAASCVGTGTSNVPAKDVLDLINEKRAAAGCPPVEGDDELRVAAERLAADIRDHGENLNDVHIASDGSTPLQRIQDAGFAPVGKYGETAYHWYPTATPEQTVEWWMNSPGHKAILLDCEFTHAGVGLLYPGGQEWIAIVDFGKH